MKKLVKGPLLWVIVAVWIAGEVTAAGSHSPSPTLSLLDKFRNRVGPTAQVVTDKGGELLDQAGAKAPQVIDGAANAAQSGAAHQGLLERAMPFLVIAMFVVLLIVVVNVSKHSGKGKGKGK